MITNYFNHWAFQQEGWYGRQDLCRLRVSLQGALRGPQASGTRYVLFYSEKFNTTDAQTVLTHEGKPIDGFLTGDEEELDLLIPVLEAQTKVTWISIGNSSQHLQVPFTLLRGQSCDVAMIGIFERNFANDPR